MTALGKLSRSLHNLLDDLDLLLRRERREEATAHMGEGTANIVLEEDHDDQDGGFEKPFKDQAESRELEELAREGKRDQHDQTDEDLNRAGAPDQQQ